MGGMGGVYKRGPIYWIRYHHRVREHRESARSTDRADALRLPRRRVSDLNHTGPTNEARPTFQQLADDSSRSAPFAGCPRHACSGPRRGSPTWQQSFVACVR